MKAYATSLAAAAAIVLTAVLPIQATQLAWYRFGDDDPGPVDGADIDITVNSIDVNGSFDDMVWNSAHPDYSTEVPGTLIHDPISNTDVNNTWSLHVPGVDNRERVRISEPLPSSFTYEVFVRFDDADAANEVFFGDHYRNSADGGWRLMRLPDGTIRAYLRDNADTAEVTVDSVTKIAANGLWHHVALTFNGNEVNATDDVHLYIDYNEDASGNFPDSGTFASTSSGVYFYGGSSDAGNDDEQERVDESRYFDEVLDTDSFLTIVPTGSEPTLTVNRITGAITLNNVGPDPLFFRGYSITSTRGALDVDNWKPITGNYDVDGNGSVDNNDAWTILTDTDENVTYMDLSEFEFGGDGGMLGGGMSVLLSQGTGAWLPSPDESDLMMELFDADTNETIIVPINYEGNGDQPLDRSDLNHDGSITSTDWIIFRDNHFTNLDGLTVAQAYLKGDLDHDGDSDLRDFDLFKSDYDGANGAGAFSAMIQGVPEPAGLALLGVAAIGLLLQRRRIGRLAITAAGFSAIALVASLPAQATQLGWYRFGDDDNATPTNGADINTTNNSSGTFGNLDWDTAHPDYSSDVPGSTILDPISLTKYLNTWSLHAPGNQARERVRVSQSLPSSFTYELFVRFDDLSASAPAYFGYHFRGSADGGWQLRRQADGTVRAYLRDDPDTAEVTVDSTTKIAADGRWHHVALVFDGNEANVTDDVHLYIDYVEDASGNFPDAATFAGTANGVFFYGGNADAQNDDEAERVDEQRYFNEPLGPESFLRIIPLKAVIHPLTGELVLRNDTLVPISLDGYSLLSVGADTLVPGSWNSLSDQNLDPVDGGDDPGETWDESGGSNASLLAEAFLLGSTSLGVGDFLSLGNVYDVNTSGELALEYHLSNQSGIFPGAIELRGDMDADGDIDEADVPLFVQALVDRSTYESAQPLVDADFIGDFDGNGLLDFGDVAQFSQAVANATSAAGNSETTTVPEPASALLLLLATCCLFTGRRRC